MNNEPFVIERIYAAPIDRVWKAISDKHEMRQWYFDVSDFKPEIGFEFQFEGNNEGRIYIHLCKVTEVVTGRKLQYSWSYQGYQGLSYVTFELFAEGNKTRLKLTHQGLETFPDIDDFRKENFVAGWTAIIGQMLPAWLEGKNVTITP